MTAEQYKNAGFRLSQLIAQAEIDRAERDVRAAYIEPIVGDMESEQVDAAVMELAYMLLLKRNCFATRSGAKEKATPQGYTAQIDAIQRECAAACDLRLQELRALDGAVQSAKVNDICGIYFVTYQFYK